MLKIFMLQLVTSILDIGSSWLREENLRRQRKLITERDKVVANPQTVLELDKPIAP